MKKLIALLTALILCVGLAACGGSPEAEPEAEPETIAAGGYVDGTYTSEMYFEGDDGYQDKMSLTIEGGRIASVEWNGVRTDGGDDRRTAAANGSYDVSDWHEQADLLQAKLIETQDPYAIELNDDGTPANVPGVTINAEFFVELADAALYDAIPIE